MKFTRIATYVLFLALFILAGVFFLERIIYTDSAGMLFKLVNFKKLNVEAYRYTAEIPKMLPLFLTYLGVGLKWITLSLSISYIILYFILFLISEYVFKNKHSGLLILFVLIITSSHTFFHPVTETHQALVYCILFYSLISSRFFNQNKLPSLILALFIVAVSFFAHPVAIFPVLFIIAFYAITNNSFKDYRIYFIAGFLVLLVIIKMLTTKSTGYEGKLLGNITDLESLYSNFINSYTLGWFLKRLSWSYLIHALVFGGLLFQYYRRGDKLKFLLVSITIPVFIIFTILAYYQGDNDTMLEKSFMPLSLLIGIPLFYELARLQKNMFKYFSIAIIVLIVVNLGSIIKESGNRNQRIVNIEKVLDLMKNNNYCKAIVDIEIANKIGLGPTWALSNESLIVSIIKNQESRTFYVPSNPEKIAEYSVRNDMFLYYPFYPAINHNVINEDYFKLCDERYYNITDLVKARFN